MRGFIMNRTRLVEASLSTGSRGTRLSSRHAETLMRRPCF